jgi:L-rhamnonate dehydratase
VANPLSRYAQYKRHRNLWTPKWGDVWCKATLEDGTWGLGHTGNAPAAVVIQQHLGPLLVGEDVLAGEKLADIMFRATKPYGSTGLASYAVSAIDLALWDARGKLLEKPVYELLGGPQKERMFCYVTGNDVDWYLELGFQAVKLACPYGPTDRLDGINQVDILRPDIEWCGGVTTCQKIAAMADAAGVAVILHAGGNTV